MPKEVEVKRIEDQETLSVEHSTIFQGDALSVLRRLPANSVRCAMTSPPYWGLRDYGVEK